MIARVRSTDRGRIAKDHQYTKWPKILCLVAYVWVLPSMIASTPMHNCCLDL